jgi:predicted amidophosphoribosyltransferase
MHGQPRIITKQYDWVPPACVGMNLTQAATWMDLSIGYVKSMLDLSEGRCRDCGRPLDRLGVRCIPCIGKKARRQKNQRERRKREQQQINR